MCCVSYSNVPQQGKATVTPGPTKTGFRFPHGHLTLFRHQKIGDEFGSQTTPGHQQNTKKREYKHKHMGTNGGGPPAKRRKQPSDKGHHTLTAESMIGLLSRFYAEYVHRPTPSMGWHWAVPGQPPLPEPGWQIKAQYVGWEAPLTSKAHSAWAVAPDGGLGQEPSELHGGEQKAPDTPSIVTFNSLAPHFCLYGSS
jgi:hypothetical protein